MHLIVGLGNPSSAYRKTRHNLGFQVVEALASRLQAGQPKQGHRSLFVVATYCSRRLILAQPLTYMNRSGLAVKELVNYYKIDLDNLLVIYDDLDLPPGTVRIRKRGSSAGHRGIQSIIDVLNTSEFPRLRIGVGKPPPFMEAADYVLQPFPAEEKEVIDEAISRAGEAVQLYISDGIETAMNKFNQ